jgi:putative Mg2+ transporter-C (MgtC) family protein
MLDWELIAQDLAALLAAAVLGGLVGLEREVHHHPAGLRTHILVSLGAALFVLAGLSIAGNADALTRVIQGIAAGIGFIGAGTILKLTDRLEVKGLTTAASIWLAAAVGVAAGSKLYVLAASGTFVSLVVLGVLGRWEAKHAPQDEPKKPERPDPERHDLAQ